MNTSANDVPDVPGASGGPPPEPACTPAAAGLACRQCGSDQAGEEGDPAPAHLRFNGWHRPGPGRPWVLLVQGREGEGEGPVLDRLLSAVAGGDKFVLPAGQDPNRRQARGRSDA
jgi:hypothetical protein